MLSTGSVILCAMWVWGAYLCVSRVCAVDENEPEPSVLARQKHHTVAVRLELVRTWSWRKGVGISAYVWNVVSSVRKG